MSDRDVVRFWKDAEFRSTLTAGERAAFPANPAGPLELSEGDLEGVRGGGIGDWILSVLLSYCLDTLCSCECSSGLECGFQTAKVC